MRSSRFVISTRVGIQNSEGQNVRFKKVTLATFHCVEKDECPKLFKAFALDNDHIDMNRMMGEYFTQESIYPRD